jgi:hypothetical protein
LDGDLVYFHNGALKTFRSSLRGEFPRQIEAEPGGTVLAAAPYGGLIGLRMGKIQVLTKRNGLPCDGVLGFVEDNEKNWWLETPCGYVMVADSEVQRWWVHPDTQVQYRFFDVSEGARTRSVSCAWKSGSTSGRASHANYTTRCCRVFKR